MSNHEEPITISLAKYYSGPNHVPLGRPGIMGPKISSALVITGMPAGGAQVVHHQYKENGESSVEKKDLSAEELAPMSLLVKELLTLPARKTPGGSDIYGANTSVVVSQGRNVLWQHSPGGGCVVSPDDEDEDGVAAFADFDAHKKSFAHIVGQIYKDAGAGDSTGS
ncbi:hypothetical protein IWW37_000220 [Coemansia sp. RSA 2050]|nr:hypothetical protein IWW37_000220 [Coemansia sp. RSA 2050]KAJ2737177.1 hypothetical protein IW152_000198 [Coemansia sp. BCRC 34962]